MLSASRTILTSFTWLYRNYMMVIRIKFKQASYFCRSVNNRGGVTVYIRDALINDFGQDNFDFTQVNLINDFGQGNFDVTQVNC